MSEKWKYDDPRRIQVGIIRSTISSSVQSAFPTLGSARGMAAASTSLRFRNL